ncbi:hypothetical protein NJ7G_4039 [Natrinema sp. J7-2]|nr:hypothetical protein NJ7G_4039 [Natrinema sp. J7-2]
MAIIGPRPRALGGERVVTGRPHDVSRSMPRSYQGRPRSCDYDRES